MKKALLMSIFAVTALLWTGCKHEKSTTENLGDDVTSIAKDLDYSKSENLISLYRESDSLTKIGKIDLAKMQLFVDRSTQFAEENPKDTLSPHFLLYAAIFQMEIASSNPSEVERKELWFKSIDRFNKVIKQFPEYRNLPYCYFYKGQIYENLGRLSDAESEYRELVHLYPKSELGKSTDDYLKSRGFEKSAEQIWSDIQSNDKKRQTNR